MSSFEFNTKEILSIGKLSKETRSVINHIQTDVSKYIVCRNNEPVAVMLSPETYNEIMEELEDARLSALARDRLQQWHQLNPAV